MESVSVQKQLVEKNPLSSNDGIELGYILELNGKIGLESDSKNFAKIIEYVKQIKTDFISAVIVLDAVNVDRWDTYALKTIIPTILEANAQLKGLGRPPIVIVGDSTRDIYEAVEERWGVQKAKEIPWFPSLVEFKKAYKLP